MRAYFASLLALGKARQAWLMLLVLAGTVVEGLGILLLIPLSGLIFGWPVGGGGLNRLAEPVLALFGRGEGLALVLAGFTVLMLVRAAILIRRDTGLFALSAELVDAWRARMISALVGAEWRKLRDLDRGSVEFAVTGDVARLAAGSDQLLRGAVALVQLIVLIVLAIQLAPRLALATVALMLAAVPLAVVIGRAAYVHGQTLTGKGGKRHRAFVEFMAGMKLAKAHGAEQQYAREFLLLSAELRDSGLRYTALRLRANSAFELLAVILAGLLLWAGTMLFAVSPAVLGALVLTFARMPGPALALTQGAQSLAMIAPSIENLEGLERDLAGDPVPPEQAPPHGFAPARIELSAVRFRHNADKPLLEGIDLALATGELAVLMGPSGSGKTSLGDLAIGLAVPDSGTIAIDGAPLASPAERAAWRQRIGYVPQDPFLFDATLAENLTWAAADADDAQIWAALAAADAADFVRGLPAGLATRAGDRGGHLSGGERQRLCLARALLRRPAFLLLDEPTSALDAESEARLLGALQGLRGKVTILMIAHRIPGDFEPDRIIHLVDGRIAP